MITRLILEFLASLPLLLLSQFSGLSVELPAFVFTPLLDIVSGIGSVMPVRQLLPILAVELVIRTAHITWAIVIRAKSFIPTMGA